MGWITPLLFDFWLWLALVAFWVITAFFTSKTRTRERWIQIFEHAIPLYLGIYLLFAKRPIGPLDYRLYKNNSLAWFGTILTLAGVIFAIWARMTIGRFWSGIITLKEEHKLIRSGPYAITRHPIYTGFAAAAIGTAISAARVDAVAGAVLIIASLLWKLRHEETLLTGEFGAEYVRFKREVPAIFPIAWLTTSANEPIQSEAFQRAAQRSDQFRIIGMLCVCGTFIVLDVASMLADANTRKRYVIFMCWWGMLAAYELVFLIITSLARRRGRTTQKWLWVVNTVIECLLPSLALFGLTGDKSYLGPYRALVSSSVSIYFFFIILSTLRLSAALCLIAGLVCAAGYTAVYVVTLLLAPHNDYAHMMPQQVFIYYPIMIAGAGLLAAAVAHQIRRHVIAALNEAETRRKLDRIEYDLNIARSIQMGLLPKEPPKIAGYDIAGWSQPAEHTGGDYYDWLELPAGKMMFTIADATGHGIGPALLIAACRAYFRAIAARENPLEQVAQQVDALIAADVSDGRFITAAIALLDTTENRLSLYSAGHAPIYFYTAATKKVDALEADQPPLGTWQGFDGGAARVITLAPGDSLILITDGFFECSNSRGEMLGMHRLAEFLASAQSKPALELIDAMHKYVLNFSYDQPQADDLTAVVIKRL